METSDYPTFYVTAKGSVKGQRGILLLPGDVFPTKGWTEKQLQSLFEAGTICTDKAKAFTVQEPPQTPLPMNEAGTDTETPPPAKAGFSDTTEARQALREARNTAKKTNPAIEVLGAGPVRIKNDEIIPVTDTDPSNVTIDDGRGRPIVDADPSKLTLADLEGKNLSVEEFNALKN